jgi:hypothetical protein
MSDKMMVRFIARLRAVNGIVGLPYRGVPTGG